jgi:hypothetical protein
MEPLWVIKVRRNYRPWWAPWRKRVPTEYRSWRDGRPVDDIFDIEIYKSLYEGTQVRLNGLQVSRAQVWVDDAVYVQVPDISETLQNAEIHMSGGGREITDLQANVDWSEPSVHTYCPKEADDG